MSVVVDASALLAFVQDEPGADIVERALTDGARCSTANWSEVAQKVRAAGRDWDLVRALLYSYGPVLEPVTVTDAETAARRWKPGQGLSLADRLCLALAERTSEVVVSADRAWGDAAPIRQIR